MLASGCGTVQQQVLAPIKEVTTSPITGRFMQVPKTPVCMDEGAKEYAVAELEAAVICYRSDAQRARDNQRLLIGAVEARQGKVK